MMDAPSSTWFTAAPHWQWYIILYFFLGGLAGGARNPEIACNRRPR